MGASSPVKYYWSMIPGGCVHTQEENPMSLVHTCRPSSVEADFPRSRVHVHSKNLDGDEMK